MFFKFKKNDVIVNSIKTTPKVEFFIHSGTTYYNDNIHPSGTNTQTLKHIPSGYVSLYELNVDRRSDQLIRPFITKSGQGNGFKTVSILGHGSQFNYGDIIEGSYPLSSSMQRSWVTQTGNKRLRSIKNTLNYYKILSKHYSFSSSLGDKNQQELSLLSIPTIFYGSTIEKGSVELKFYVTGTLIGTLKDTKKNGELVQTYGELSTNNGSTAGVVLYNEGIMLLTGSWSISTHTEDYRNTASNVSSSWKYWGASGSTSNRLISSSYKILLSGTNYVPTMTMLANAPRGLLNNSSNPTFVSKTTIDNKNFVSSSLLFKESQKLRVKNTTSLPYSGSSGSFERQVFISQIGIYDEDKRLIAIAKLAKPVKKTSQRNYTFKLKLDL